MYCTLCRIQRNLDGCIVRFTEQLRLYTVNYKAKVTILRGALKRKIPKETKKVTHTYQSKCDFQRNLDGCITPFASEASLDCKLAG